MNAWASGFRAQAAVDFQSAEYLLDKPEFHSQATMLLQMAWEKLAKSALVGRPDYRASHHVASKFVRNLKHDARRFGRAMGLGPNGAAARLTELAQQLTSLEGLAPQRAGGENSEYPWESGGKVLWPARDLRRDFTSAQPRRMCVWRDFHAVARYLRSLPQATPRRTARL